MKNNYSSQIVKGFKFLGIYQIIGGLIGFVWTTLYIFHLSQLLFIGLSLIPLSLFVYSIISGILLLKKKTSGLLHSTINQFLQLIGISFMGYSYNYFAGIYITMGLDLTNSLNFFFRLGISTWLFEINSGVPTIYLNFNFVALFLILYITKLKIKVETQWMQDQISQIGEPAI